MADTIVNSNKGKERISNEVNEGSYTKAKNKWEVSQKNQLLIWASSEDLLADVVPIGSQRKAISSGMKQRSHEQRQAKE